jgi:hypothetical protein
VDVIFAQHLALLGGYCRDVDGLSPEPSGRDPGRPRVVLTSWSKQCHDGLGLGRGQLWGACDDEQLPGAVPQPEDKDLGSLQGSGDGTDDGFSAGPVLHRDPGALVRGVPAGGALDYESFHAGGRLVGEQDQGFVSVGR